MREPKKTPDQWATEKEVRAIQDLNITDRTAPRGYRSMLRPAPLKSTVPVYLDRDAYRGRPCSNFWSSSASVVFLGATKDLFADAFRPRLVSATCDLQHMHRALAYPFRSDSGCARGWGWSRASLKRRLFRVSQLEPEVHQSPVPLPCLHIIHHLCPSPGRVCKSVHVCVSVCPG